MYSMLVFSLLQVRGGRPELGRGRPDEDHGGAEDADALPGGAAPHQRVRLRDPPVDVPDLLREPPLGTAAENGGARSQRHDSGSR